MSLVDWVMGRKPNGRAAVARPRTPAAEQIKATKAAIGQVVAGEGPAAGRFPKLTDARPEVLTLTQTSATVAKDGPAPSANIWDMEELSAALAMAPEPAPVQEAAPQKRPTRNKTRVLGFEPQAASVVPLFDEGRMDETGEPGNKANVVSYPTGWLIVKKGPGRGATFALPQGVAQVGRGSDQTVALDFGDMTISRQNHAAIAYDARTHQFHIGHGGKSNLVRLNGKPLLSTEPIRDGDEVQIGETTLLLKVLCTPAFNWSQSDAGGDGHDMAIA